MPLVAYGFVKLCQYYQHAGSVYAFVGAARARAGVVSGIGLLGTYTFYAVVTSSAAGLLGRAFLTQAGIWPDRRRGCSSARRLTRCEPT
ncbi:hypothetical protein [Amycolatopsis sp. NBC_00438]|uniref:hypothetical protein n=1 Tax=Amycolatopsis sp. NBC_00438 TaxID=2903558 RepID=UPI002E1E3364